MLSINHVGKTYPNGVHALERFSTEIRPAEIVAIIGDSAHEASIRLHANLGFRMVGTLNAVGFKFGRWVDSVLMQRALDPDEPVDREHPAAAGSSGARPGA